MSGVINQSYIVRINSLNDRASAEYDRLLESLTKIRERIKSYEIIDDSNSKAYDKLIQVEKQLNIKMIKIDSLKIELESKKVQYQSLLHDKDELLKLVAKKEEQYEDGIKAIFASALNVALSIIGYLSEKADINLSNLVSSIFPLITAIYFIVNSILKRGHLNIQLNDIEKKKMTFDDENFKILNDKLALNLGEYLTDNDISNYLIKLNKSINESESNGIDSCDDNNNSSLRKKLRFLESELSRATNGARQKLRNDFQNDDIKQPYFQSVYDVDDIEHRSKLESSRPASIPSSRPMSFVNDLSEHPQTVPITINNPNDNKYNLPSRNINSSTNDKTSIEDVDDSVKNMNTVIRNPTVLIPTDDDHKINHIRESSSMYPPTINEEQAPNRVRSPSSLSIHFEN